MSDYHIGGIGGTPPPAVPLQFTADDEDAVLTAINQPNPTNVVPTANTLQINGDNGIQTYALTNLLSGDTNVLQVGFSRGSATTVDAATADVLTFPTSTDSCFTMQVLVAGISNDNLGIGGYTTATIINVAGVASLVDTPDIIIQANAALAAGSFDIIASGANVIIRTTGVAGKTIVWSVCTPGIVISPPN